LARLILDLGEEAIVVLEDGNAIGCISQDELVQAYCQGDYDSLKAVDIMRDVVPQLPPEIPLMAAAQLMQDMGVRAAFIMHNAAGAACPAAVLTYRHLLRLLAAQDPQELRDLGINAERQSPVEAFIQKRNAARDRSRSDSQQ
jgi:predicted transcriptional regulator